MKQQRLTIISSDCHAGATPDTYRGYVAPKLRGEYDRWLEAAAVATQSRASGAIKVDTAGAKRRKWFAEQAAVKEGGMSGAWDSAVRLRELDREGLAGEVLFADGQNKNHPPFGVGFAAPRMEVPLKLRQAGCRAHNRWLADFCSAAPERQAGVALIAPDDPKQAVREIEWARKAGLRGGIMLPALSLWTDDPEKFWNHPRYEPIWAACADLDMPVHTHAAGPTLNYGDLPGARWILTTEVYLTTYRLLWFLLWPGVLERYPKLNVVITEAGGGLIPYLLQLFDYLAAERNVEMLRQLIKLKPSEYWARQCFIGASPPGDRPEVDARQALGVRSIMWGSDYPHIEGTWPKSHERLKTMFAGVPEGETRAMLGGNAAKLYGFDLKKLRPIAQRIGPTVADLA